MALWFPPPVANPCHDSTTLPILVFQFRSTCLEDPTAICVLVDVHPSSRQSRWHARFFSVPFWRSRRGLGSRRLCGRRRRHRLELEVRSSRFVIVREIPNATPFRVATFTRTTPPVPKNAKRDAYRTFPQGRLFGRKYWEGMWLFRILGCRRFAHDSQRSECPGELWVARRGLLLYLAGACPSREGG